MNDYSQPLKHVWRLLTWLARAIIWMLVEMTVLPADAYPNYDSEREYIINFSTCHCGTRLNNQPHFFLSYSAAYDYYSEASPTENSANASILLEPRQRVLGKTKPQPCDKVVQLYVLNTEKTVFQKPAVECERPFVAIPVVNSNLLLVVIDTMCTYEPGMRLIRPEEVIYNESTVACYKSRYGTLNRRSFSKCISAHEKEETIELCGDGHRIQAQHTVFLGVLLALLSFLGHLQLIRIDDDH